MVILAILLIIIGITKLVIIISDEHSSLIPTNQLQEINPDASKFIRDLIIIDGLVGIFGGVSILFIV